MDEQGHTDVPEATRTPGALRIELADLAAAKEVVREFEEHSRYVVESAAAGVERIFRVHEHGAGFYEKLILLDGGTIALSLSLLGSLLSHSPGVHLPKTSFLWLVCPAWGLLLISVYCSWIRIISFQNINVSLAKQVSAQSSDFNLQMLGRIATRMSKAVKGEIRLGEDHLDLNAALAQIATSTADAAREQQRQVQKLIDQANREANRTKIYARVALICTEVGILLLCVFAVRALLAA
jgi:hypothetical protein